MFSILEFCGERNMVFGGSFYSRTNDLWRLKIRKYFGEVMQIAGDESLTHLSGKFVAFWENVLLMPLKKISIAYRLSLAFPNQPSSISFKNSSNLIFTTRESNISIKPSSQPFRFPHNSFSQDCNVSVTPLNKRFSCHFICTTFFCFPSIQDNACHFTFLFCFSKSFSFFKIQAHDTTYARHSSRNFAFVFI